MIRQARSHWRSNLRPAVIAAGVTLGIALVCGGSLLAWSNLRLKADAAAAADDGNAMRGSGAQKDDAHAENVTAAAGAATGVTGFHDGGCRSDFDHFGNLPARIGYGHTLKRRLYVHIFHISLLQNRVLDLFRFGAFRGFRLPAFGSPGFSGREWEGRRH
jgi:hypothetical protein